MLFNINKIPLTIQTSININDNNRCNSIKTSNQADNMSNLLHFFVVRFQRVFYGLTATILLHFLFHLPKLQSYSFNK